MTEEYALCTLESPNIIRRAYITTRNCHIPTSCHRVRNFPDGRQRYSKKCLKKKKTTERNYLFDNKPRKDRKMNKIDRSVINGAADLSDFVRFSCPTIGMTRQIGALRIVKPIVRRETLRPPAERFPYFVTSYNNRRRNAFEMVRYAYFVGPIAVRRFRGTVTPLRKRFVRFSRPRRCTRSVSYATFGKLARFRV